MDKKNLKSDFSAFFMKFILGQCGMYRTTKITPSQAFSHLWAPTQAYAYFGSCYELCDPKLEKMKLF